MGSLNVYKFGLSFKMSYKKTAWQVAELIQIFDEGEERPITERSYADMSTYKC